MTIGIGVLCSTYAGIDRPARPRPDALVMMADTMGSIGCADSTQVLHKLFASESNNLFAVGSGHIEVASEMFATINLELPHLTEPRSYGAVWRTLSRIANGYRSERFSVDVIAPRFTYILGQIPVPEHDNLMREWRDYHVGADLLVGTFALLFYIGPMQEKLGLVHTQMFPGCFAIGSGGYNATVWLNYRNQNLGMSLVQSSFHAYEASLMASSSPNVNSYLDVVVATKDKAFEFSTYKDAPADCPVSLVQLRNLAEKLGPQKTNSLGFDQEG